jgi:hypothetical protein
MTDEFGPCGIGWGFTILSERFERFSDTDTLHVAVVRLWYVMDSKRGELEQVGQTKSSYMSSGGKFILDEDAPKKSVTDALVKCASYLGFAGDIFSGRWDDSRYVAEANKEWREREAAADGKPAVDMRPKARAVRIMTGVAAGDAEGAAAALAQMDEQLCAEIWKHIAPDYQDKLTAAWPVAA